MTSWNGNIFRVTCPLCGEFTGHRWIPRTKASDFFSLSCTRINGWVNNSKAGDLRYHRAHYDVPVCLPVDSHYEGRTMWGFDILLLAWASCGINSLMSNLHKLNTIISTLSQWEASVSICEPVRLYCPTMSITDISSVNAKFGFIISLGSCPQPDGAQYQNRQTVTVSKFPLSM